MTSILIDLAVRSSVILAAGLVIAAALRGRTAALRHAVLSCALLGAVAVVPIHLMLPPLQVSLPSVPRAAVTMRDTSATPDRSNWYPGATRVRVHSASCLCRRGRVGRGLWRRAVHLAGRARPAAADRAARDTRDGRPVGRSAEAVARDYGLSRRVALLQTDSPVCSPRGASGGHACCCRPAPAAGRRIASASSSATSWPTSGGTTGACRSAPKRSRRSSGSTRSSGWPARACGARASGRAMTSCCGSACRPATTPRICSTSRGCAAGLGTPGPSATPMSHPCSKRRIAAMLNPRLDRRPLSRRRCRSDGRAAPRHCAADGGTARRPATARDALRIDLRRDRRRCCPGWR